MIEVMLTLKFGVMYSGQSWNKIILSFLGNCSYCVDGNSKNIVEICNIP